MNFRPHEWVVILISVYMCLELLFWPDLHGAKKISYGPIIKMGVTFSLSELFTIGFVSVYLLVLLFRDTGRLHLPRGGMAILILVIAMTMGLSMLFGALISAPRFFEIGRAFLIPSLLPLIFFNLHLRPKVEQLVFRLFIVTTFVGAGMITIKALSKYWSSFPLSPPEYWGSLNYLFAISILLPSIMLVKLILERKLLLIPSLILFWWLILVLANVSYKVGSLMFFVLFVITVVWGISNNKYSRRKVVMVFIVLSLATTSIYSTLPSSIKFDLMKTIAARYLKHTDFEDNSNIDTAISLVGQRDLSAGRFDIWKSYITDSFNGFGLAPRGFGASSDIFVVNRYEKDKGAHNIFVLFTYHGGLLTGLSMIAMLFIYLRWGWILGKRPPKEMLAGLDINVGRGVYIYTVALIAFNTVGLAMSEPRLAWFFWFCVIVVARRIPLIYTRNTVTFPMKHGSESHCGYSSTHG